MKRFIILLCLAGCSSSPDPSPGVEAPVPPHDVPSGLCCQLTSDVDPYWGLQRYECSVDSGDYSAIPWLCNVAPDASANLMDCENPSCVVGMSCQGQNGFGVVLACDTVVY